MTAIEILLWIVVWVIGTFVSLVILYQSNEKITLASLIVSIILWWVVIPGAVVLASTMGFVWLCENASEIVLFEKKQWWLSKKDRKALKEKK
jgi:hypothetical protein